MHQLEKNVGVKKKKQKPVTPSDFHRDWDSAVVQSCTSPGGLGNNYAHCDCMASAPFIPRSSLVFDPPAGGPPPPLALRKSVTLLGNSNYWFRCEVATSSRRNCIRRSTFVQESGRCLTSGAHTLKNGSKCSRCLLAGEIIFHYWNCSQFVSK